MFIEKYQPYTSLLITYNGEEIDENNPIILPTTVNGEYKVNLDAIGVDDEGEREDLPFTRNDITWWLLDDVNGILTKEINVGDNAGSKFTIEDSGTLSIISTSFSAPENTSLEVVCVLGKPNSLNVNDFDFDAIPNANTVLPFTCGGGGGGGGGVIFPAFTMSANPDPEGNPVWSSTLTYEEVKATYNEYKAGVTLPFVFVNDISSETFWNICEFYDDFSHITIPEEAVGVTEGFLIFNTTLFSNDGNFYIVEQ